MTISYREKQKYLQSNVLAKFLIGSDFQAPDLRAIVYGQWIQKGNAALKILNIIENEDKGVFKVSQNIVVKEKRQYFDFYECQQGENRIQFDSH